MSDQEPIRLRMGEDGIFRLANPTVEIDEVLFEAMLELNNAAIRLMEDTSEVNINAVEQAVEKLKKVADA